jgi:hypothetical protein
LDPDIALKLHPKIEVEVGLSTLLIFEVKGQPSVNFPQSSHNMLLLPTTTIPSATTIFTCQ